MSDTASARFINRPSSIEYGPLKFLIMDAPNDQLLPTYAEMLKKRHVKVVIRACEPTYDPSLLEENGIQVVDMAFPDGDVPTSSMILKWINILKSQYPSVYDKKSSSTRNTSSSKQSEPQPTDQNNDNAIDGSETHSGNKKRHETKKSKNGDGGNGDTKVAIAVHCIASLGRSPLLVAVALIEAGCTVTDAVNIVRSKRKGAFNTKQLRYLMEYKRSETTTGCCTIM